MAVDREAAQRAVEELVAHYQAKARAVGRLGVASGASVGVLVGSVPLSPLRFAWPIPSGYGFATILGGLVVGVLVGYVIGDARAQMYQRMAEQARLQLQLEQRISENDARMAQLLTALTARAAASPRHATQVPQPGQALPPIQPPPIPVPHIAVPPRVQVQQPALSESMPIPTVTGPASAPAEPLRPAAVVVPQPAQPQFTQVPPAAASNGQGAPDAPPLSPPVSR